MQRWIVGFLAVSASWALSGPSGLAVPSATNKQVKLTWSAAGSDTTQYIIERRALDAQDFQTIATVVPDMNKVLATTFTDAAFDPFVAYVYRVRASNASVTPADVSGATNDVTVGPPPYGYTRIVATPDKLSWPGNLGVHTQMILDGSGDPMITYLYLDPNFDGEFSDTTIWFLRWDRAHYKWTDPVKVAVPGDIDGGATFNFSFRLARDASNGNLGIIFVDNSGMPDIVRLSLADSSDNGATWRKRLLLSDPQSSFRVPALALGGGNVYSSFYQDSFGIKYMTGKLSDDPAKWTSEIVPMLGYQYYQVGSDIALDNDGKPAVAFVATDDAGHHEIFYRPGSTPLVANSSADGPGDFWEIHLTFSGTNPRIVFAGMMDSLYFETYDNMLFMLSSQDKGVTWSSRANIKSDGNSDLGGIVDFSFDSKGRAAVVSEVLGGNPDGVKCGAPKLSLSSDLQAWSTCGISATIVSGARSPSVKFALNDTLYLAYSIADYPYDASSPTEMAAGVYFWRGPIGFEFPQAPPMQ